LPFTQQETRGPLARSAAAPLLCQPVGRVYSLAAPVLALLRCVLVHSAYGRGAVGSNCGHGSENRERLAGYRAWQSSRYCCCRLSMAADGFPGRNIHHRLWGSAAAVRSAAPVAGESALKMQGRPLAAAPFGFLRRRTAPFSVVEVLAWRLDPLYFRLPRLFPAPQSNELP